MIREELLCREDVINLALDYSLSHYSQNDIFENVLDLNETDFTKIKMKDKRNNLENIIKDYIIYYTKNFSDDSELIFPARGLKCKHSETINFSEYFKKVAITHKCPICNNNLKINEIIIDFFLYNILQFLRAGTNLETLPDFIVLNRKDLTWKIL